MYVSLLKSDMTSVPAEMAVFDTEDPLFVNVVKRVVEESLGSPARTSRVLEMP